MAARGSARHRGAWPQARKPHRRTTRREIPPALSIAQFYGRVRQALLAEFADDIWIVGEIRSIRESKGHHYIELADEGTERKTAAQLEVACWAREWPRVRAQLAEARVSLEPGRVVRVRGRVSIWEGGSKIRFTLTEIDIASLLGGIAAARRKLLAALEAEGLLEANRKLEIPLVPLRIGLVTSPGSEGHNDFTGQLERCGFAFTVVLEPSLVQGPEAPVQVAAALASTTRRDDRSRSRRARRRIAWRSRRVRLGGSRARDCNGAVPCLDRDWSHGRPFRRGRGRKPIAHHADQVRRGRGRPGRGVLRRDRDEPRMRSPGSFPPNSPRQRTRSRPRRAHSHVSSVTNSTGKPTRTPAPGWHWPGVSRPRSYVGASRPRPVARDRRIRDFAACCKTTSARCTVAAFFSARMTQHASSSVAGA